MNQIRQLAGQTAVYGMGTIVPKLLNFAFLTPYYVRVFAEGQMGAISELYAYVVILNVIVTFGMETGFFRYTQDKALFRSVYTTAFLVVAILSAILVSMVNIFVEPVAALIQYEDNPNFITWFSMIIALDAMAAIPFAKLRRENRARHFSVLKLLNVLLTIGLVVFFISLWPKLVENNPQSWLNQWYNPDLGVGYVFLANLIASSVIFLLLIPELKQLGGPMSKKVWVDLLQYSAPLVVVGIAGSINEVADKIMLKFLYAGNLEAMDQVGIYSANFRLAVIMTLFVQMFKYAFEPFLFSQRGKDSDKVYVQIMDIFIALGIGIYLATTLFVDILATPFFGNQGKSWTDGIGVVPVVMMANLVLGIDYSLSVWYKLTALTRYAAVMALVGSIITLGMNFILIPIFSYQGSAWAHLVTYATMMIISYLWGRKHMPIPYHVKRNLTYILAGGLTLLAYNYLRDLWPQGRIFMGLLILAVYGVIVEKQLHVFRLFFSREEQT